jgi:hypothetical protein
LFIGILAKVFLDSLQAQGTGFSVVRLVVAVIVATAIFPAVYKNSMGSTDPGLVQLCVTFTAGLGYKSLIDISV